MLKKILNLDGAKELNQNEKKSINGGRRKCPTSPWDPPCPVNSPCCSDGYCKDNRSPFECGGGELEL